MNHDDSDAELLRRARAGAAPAFAVLVYRYAALLHLAAARHQTGARPTAPDTAHEDVRLPAADGEADPPIESSDDAALATVRQTFLRAMRRLDSADERAVGTWLLELQGTPLAREDAERAAPLATAELDRLWGELAPCWPRGRRQRRPPRWLGHVAVVVVLLLLAVAVPYTLLVTIADEEEDAPVPVAEVVAVPIEDDEFDLRFEDAPAETEGSETEEGDRADGADGGADADGGAADANGASGEDGASGDGGASGDDAEGT